MENGDDLEPIGRKEVEVTGRNFRITEMLLEKYGRTEGCPGCEARVLGDYKMTSGSLRRHTDECRARLESQMKDTEDDVRIRKKSAD